MSHLRLSNTTKGFYSQYQSIIDSSSGQDPESSGNFVEPTVTTERNLTAYGINRTKYVRRVLVGHRKIYLNRASNGISLKRNMTLMVGHVSRNDILTNIPDRLPGLSDEVRPLDGKGLKSQDGRFEENPIKEDLEKETQEENEAVHHQEEGVPESVKLSEHPKRMSRKGVDAGTTPSPSLPLATTQVQTSLVPSETQDQSTNKRQTPVRDRHHTKTSLHLPSSFKYSGRPKLPGSSASLINSRQPTSSISSIISNQRLEYKNPVGNASSVQSSHPLGGKKETLKRKTTASQESKPGLLTESAQGLNRDSSVTTLPEGTTDTVNVNRDKFPKHKETINKTVPLYHRMSHRGTFPRRPIIGPFQNRSSTHHYSYRRPLHRPILARVNNTANNVESGIISSRQSVLNPNNKPTITWQGKNGTVIRFPPKHQIKPNIKNDNGSRPGVIVDKKSTTIFPADNGADSKVNLSLSTVNAPSKSNDTIQPVSEGSGNISDHSLPRVTNRDSSTTWQTIHYHQRVPVVVRQNASNLKFRPTLKRKNNTVIRLPSKLHTQVNVNTTTSLLKDSKYETRHKDSTDARKESQIGLPTYSDTNLFANIAMSTEEAPRRTNETPQPISGGSENASNHTNKEHSLHTVTTTDHNLSRVTSRDQDLPRVTNRDSNTTIQMLFNPKDESEFRNVPDTKVVKESKESIVTLSTDKHTVESNYKLQAVAGGSEDSNDNILPSITNRDQDLASITSRDYHLPRVTKKDQDLPSNANRDSSTTTKQVINQKIPSENISSRDKIPNQNPRPKYTPSNKGRLHPKPQTQKKQNATTIQSGLKGADLRVEKGSNGSIKFTVQAVDNIPLRITNRDNSTAMPVKAEFISYDQNGLTPNFTATFSMRKKNGTLFKDKLKSKINPNHHGGPKQMKENSTARHSVNPNTLNRNPRPHVTQQRKNGTIIRLPTKGFHQLRPNSTAIHHGTKGSQNSTDDPKFGGSSDIPFSTGKASSQTNATFPSTEVSEDGISQVKAQNVTSKEFIIIWVAPEGRYKNFVIRIIEEQDEGVNEGDGHNQEEGGKGKEGSEIITSAFEVVRRNSSRDGVRKKFLKLLPGSARSFPVTDLTAQTGYAVTLYGTGPGLRSNVHTFSVKTGTRDLKVQTTV